MFINKGGHGALEVAPSRGPKCGDIKVLLQTTVMPSKKVLDALAKKILSRLRSCKSVMLFQLTSHPLKCLAKRMEVVLICERRERSV